MAAKKKPTPARGKSKHLTPQHAAFKSKRRRAAAGPKLTNEPGPVTVTDPDSNAMFTGGVM